jgi:hypothetical protein
MGWYMGINIEIIYMDTEQQVCQVKIHDGAELVVDCQNIGLELNQDGTADTAWIKNRAKELVFGHRETVNATNTIIGINT